MFKKIAWCFFYLGLPLIFFSNILPQNVHIPFVSLNWYRNVNNPIDNLKHHHSVDFKRNFYVYKNTFFYYNQNGETLHYLKIPPNISATPSNNSYFLRHKVGEQITFYKNNGEILWRLDTFSIPILSPSGKFFALLSTDQSAVSYYNRERAPLLKESFAGSLVLDYAFVPFNDQFYFGTEDGSIKGINNQGKMTFEKTLSSSRYNYIKGLSTSEDGQFISAVHGLEPEYISLFSKEGDELWSKPTDAENIRRVDVYIDPINDLVVEKQSKEIVFRRLSNGNVKHQLTLSSLIGENEAKNESIKYMKASFQKNMILLGLRSNRQGIILLLDKNFKILWKKELQDQFPLYVEVNPNNDILIQTSDFIYVYDFH